MKGDGWTNPIVNCPQLLLLMSDHTLQALWKIFQFHTLIGLRTVVIDFFVWLLLKSFKYSLNKQLAWFFKHHNSAFHAIMQVYFFAIFQQDKC